MEIRKIGTLSEEEMEVLSKAGQLLGTIKRSFESGEITELSEDARNLLGALSEVLTEVRR